MSDKISIDHDESGNAGLERTVGTTSTSTGNVERINVAPSMPDTGSLAHSSSSSTQDNKNEKQLN